MSVFVLFLYLVFLAVSFWATTRIITQAGYSPAWILMPLSSLVLTVAVFIMFFVDLRSLAYAIPFGVGGTTFLSGLRGVGVVWGLDMLTILANWILFLIFAFSRWPFSADAGRRDPAAPSPQGGAPQYGRQAPDSTQPSDGTSLPATSRTPGNPTTFSREVREEAAHDAAPSALVGASARPVRIKHCAWCGEPLPGSRALFHDCGPKDRPATNCARCGAALASEGAECAACAMSQ